MSLDFSLEEMQPVNVYRANITHNLARMAQVLGVYDTLWAPKPNTQACSTLTNLKKALYELTCYETKYTQYNASNGWGTTKDMREFLEKIYEACLANPNSYVKSNV